MLRKTLRLALCCLTLGMGLAHAQYPERTVRIVAPMAAGGGTDTVARVFAQKMAARLGQSVIVENRPGGGGQLGPELVAASPADGYTMLFTSSSALTLPYLRKTRFDLARDFVPIGQFGTGNFALVINSKLPYKTLAEFFAAVKANPGKFTYGSAGTGAVGHLALELLKAKSGLDLVHVPFKSSLEISQAMMSGTIDASIDPMTTQRPNIESGLVRGLATTGPARDSYLPNLPTITESRLVPGGYEMTYWFGVFMPIKTPAAVVERVQREFIAVMKEPDMADRLKAFSLAQSPMTAAQFQANIVAEAAMWKKLITDVGIQARD